MRSVMLNEASPVLEREAFATLLSMPGFGLDGELSLLEYLQSERVRGADSYALTLSTVVNTTWAERHRWLMLTREAGNPLVSTTGLQGMDPMVALKLASTELAKPVLTLPGERNRSWVQIRRDVQAAVTADLNSIGMNGERIAASLYRASEWTTKKIRSQPNYTFQYRLNTVNYPYATTSEEWCGRERYIRAIRKVVIE